MINKLYSNEVEAGYTLITMKYPKHPSFAILKYSNTSDRNSSSSSESENSRDEDKKTSIAYDSESADDEKSISSSIGIKENN